MLSLSPAQVGGWRAQFAAHPPDAVERLISLLCRLWMTEDPGDEGLRPWAYTAREAAERRAAREAVVESRKQEEADRKLTAFMMGG